VGLSQNNDMSLYYVSHLKVICCVTALLDQKFRALQLFFLESCRAASGTDASPDRLNHFPCARDTGIRSSKSHLTLANLNGVQMSRL